MNPAAFLKSIKLKSSLIFIIMIKLVFEDYGNHHTILREALSNHLSFSQLIVVNVAITEGRYSKLKTLKRDERTGMRWLAACTILVSVAPTYVTKYFKMKSAYWQRAGVSRIKEGDVCIGSLPS
jgi:hypothetical protein